MEYIYQADAYKRTPASIASEFARSYWDHPREVENLREENGRCFFNVVDGCRLYEIVYIPAKPLISVALYQIRVAGDHYNDTCKV